MTTKVNECDLVALSSLSSSGTSSSGDQLTISKGATSTISGTATVGSVIFGDRSLDVATASAEGATVYWTFTSPTALSCRCAFRFTGAPPVTTDVVQIQRVGGVKAASVRIATDGTVTVKDYNSAATLYTTPTKLTASGVYQFDLSVLPNSTAANGSCQFAVYDGSGNLTLGMSSVYSASGTVNVGDTATALSTVNFGRQPASGGAWNYQMDAFKASDVFGLLGPWKSTASPVTYGRHLSFGG